MKRKIFAVLTVILFALGGCADSAGENEVLINEGASDSVGGITANDEVQSMAESMAEDMAESMAQSMFESRLESMSESATEATTVSTTAVTTKKATETTTAETEDIQNVVWEYRRTLGLYVRTSEDESKTITIDSDVYPYDCEEIVINVDTEYPYYNDIEPYDCIDLGNLKNYPNLKKLSLSGNAYNWKAIKLINCDSAAGLENLKEITLQAVVWDKDWLSGISSLKKLSIEYCHDYDGKFLKDLKQVETLYLYRCAVSDLSFINEMSSLTELTLDQIRLNNASFDSVEENYSVKRLNLRENSVYTSIFSDDEHEYSLTNITGVSKLRGLEYLDVSEPYLIDKEDQMKELQEKLPACEIRF